MISSAKYHNACRIVGQSLQSPVAGRKSSAGERPRSASARGRKLDDGAEVTDVGMRSGAIARPATRRYIVRQPPVSGRYEISVSFAFRGRLNNRFVRTFDVKARSRTAF